MKIHYLSVHSVLEYDEVQLLTDLGHEVFSNGEYIDPRGYLTSQRPAIKGAKFYEDYAALALANPKTNLPTGLIEPFDLIIVMHSPYYLIENWEKIKHKNVIWRTIGQSNTSVENSLSDIRKEGLKIIRYSPKERNLHNYIGEDILIRFCKDENEFSGWHGKGQNVVTFNQSIKARGAQSHYEEVIRVLNKYKGTVYGPGNDDLGERNGGMIPYALQIKKMQEAKAMVYGGTAPASYTLSFVEGLLLGLPIVAISHKSSKDKFDFDFWEINDILEQIDGLICEDVYEMIKKTKMLLDSDEFAKDVSERQRALAVDLFGKKKIIKQWDEFLNSL